LLLSHGVAPHRIIIGHSCGTSDHDYHSTIATRGSYLGFDRFGYEDMGPGMAPHTDDARITALLRD
jgi:phosphotriesterase-related protein